MKTNGKRRWLRIALALIGAGALVFVAAFAAGGFDLKALGGGDSLARAPYLPDEDFDRVEIRDDLALVRILPAGDGVCKVQCDEAREGSCTVEVEDGVLRIQREQKWYERIGVRFDQPEVTVLLPQARYRAIDARTASGDIEIEDLEADEMKLECTSGNLTLRNVRAGELEAKSSSGDIKALDCAFEGEAELDATRGSVRIAGTEADGLSVETTSGGIEIEGVNAGQLEAESTSGGIALIDLNAVGRADLHTASGDIRLERADAGAFEIRTTSGSVRGSVLSDKLYDVKTASGNVEIPSSVRDAGEFRASTTSGDVRITVE